MTTQETLAQIGKTMAYPKDGLVYHVTIKDAKSAWGNTLFLIAPVTGSGQKWVNSAKLAELTEPAAPVIADPPTP